MKKRKFLSKLTGTLLVIATFVPGLSQAQTYSFNLFNSAGGTTGAYDASLASQFKMDVQQTGAGVSFTFFNTGANQASLTEIYFAGTTNLLDSGNWTSTSSSGVYFGTDAATPANVPGGNTISFSADTSFDSDATGSKSTSQSKIQNAVNQTNDYVTFTDSLSSGKSFADVIAALQSSNLRVALHVLNINIGSGTVSAEYLNSPVAAVPEPETWGMLLVGLGLISMKLRRKDKKKNGHSFSLEQMSAI